ncbi:UBP1-associated protein 2C-like [Nicotiana tomentosiformis]|uniref:UBP1-associated protein 2C-like n=1 Tax=Nicotiana tomentosiformis TaxID=4098 RepID=UPI00051C3534|nr:UBP1-associated protein 2C-like [Nicotiana tomentosiformis]XP_009616693.1 UBP1-associated protein 2C-like [Nicotiana tomentosiformis]
MDLTKKRKADENGGAYPVSNELVTAAASPALGVLSPEDIDRILEPFTKDQCISILRNASLRYPDILEAVRSIADADVSQRKLFVRGLGWETTTDKLKQVFSAYGELDEAIVITDKASQKSKGYGFVTFKHVDASILALKEPNKKIDGRITVTQLAAAGNSGNSQSADVALRKIYVGNVPFEITSEKLLNHFSMYGEIEEGPLGFDKQTGKAKGFAFFVYKTEEGARASLVDPVKTIDGHQVLCKLATDNKKGKPQHNMGPGGMPNTGHPTGMPGDDRVGSIPGSNYGVPVSGLGPYPGYSGGPGPGMQQPPPQPGMVAHQNPHPVGPGYGNQGPGSFTGSAGGYAGAGGYGGGAGDYSGGLGNAGYRIPQSSAGMPSSGGYPDGGSYGLQSGYPSQVPQPGGAVARVPPGGMYQGMPPYY